MTCDFPVLEKLLGEHRRFLATIDRLDAFVDQPHPGGMTCLAALRWTFVREMLLHFSHVETMALQPMRADRRPEAAARAARSSHDLRNAYDTFIRHVQRWHGMPAESEWQEYGAAVHLLARRMRVRLTAQAQDIYPLLPVLPGGARVGSAHQAVNYAAEAWKLRALIYGAETPARSA